MSSDPWLIDTVAVAVRAEGLAAPAADLTVWAIALNKGVRASVRPDNNQSTTATEGEYTGQEAESDQGKWATLKLRKNGVTLRIYYQTLDVVKRRCLAVHPVLLRERVQPLPI